jgi:hypothetical protein
MLVDTEVIDAKGLVPLRRVVDEVENLPPEQLEMIGDALCAVQEAEYPGIVGRIRAHLEQARADGDLHIQLIRVALSIGELTAHVLRPATDSAYKLSTALWHVTGSLHNTDRSIEKGFFAIAEINTDELPPLWEIANRPLLVRKREADRLLRIRPPSNAQLRRFAHAIVQECQREKLEKNQKILKGDFVKKIMKRLPSCTTTLARRAWKDFVPDSWKRPGRPRRGVRR